MQEISTQGLKELIDMKGDYVLVDVLAPESYAARHVPTARHLLKGPDFAARFEQEIGAPKDARIIVYCSSATCTASPLMGEQLEAAGYTNVWHYQDGLAGWQAANLAFEPR